MPGGTDEPGTLFACNQTWKEKSVENANRNELSRRDSRSLWTEKFNVSSVRSVDTISRDRSGITTCLLKESN